MKVFMGQGHNTPWSHNARTMREHNIGSLVCPGEWPPVAYPWVLDNAAFRAFRRNEMWDSCAFECAAYRASLYPERPYFVVAPDVVCGGDKSLILSEYWLPKLRRYGLVTYLAVQDGMSPRDPAPFDGIFIGGSVPWKLSMAPEFVRVAHAVGKPCHIGRMGTPERVEMARRWGADSIDSSAPFWTKAKMAAFLEAIK